MAVTKSFKVGSAASAGNLPASFDYTVLDTDVFCFSNRFDTIEGVLLNVWAPYLIITDATMTTINKQSKNTQYASPTTVNLLKGSDGTSTLGVTLNDVNVTREDCVIEFNWADTIATSLSLGRFYAYDKVNVNNAPTNTTVVAFERTASAIRKNRVSGDVAGKAWDAAYGVGGRANALSLADQSSTTNHSFYLGFSCKPTAYGSASSALLIEFDIS